MKRWIGRSIIAIGLIHTAFGFVFFRNTLLALFREGVFNTVDGQPKREMVFWFLYFGFLAILLGGLIDWLEASKLKFPAFLGWGLLAITIIGIIFMPVSGVWLLLFPTIGAIRQSSIDTTK